MRTSWVDISRLLQTNTKHRLVLFEETAAFSRSYGAVLNETVHPLLSHAGEDLTPNRALLKLEMPHGELLLLVISI